MTLKQRRSSVACLGGLLQQPSNMHHFMDLCFGVVGMTPISMYSGIGFGAYLLYVKLTAFKTSWELDMKCCSPQLSSVLLFPM